MDAGILVIDRDEEIFRVARELIGQLCPVVYAATSTPRSQAMQEQEIAVVVTDVEARHEDIDRDAEAAQAGGSGDPDHRRDHRVRLGDW